MRLRLAAVVVVLTTACPRKAAPLAPPLDAGVKAQLRAGIKVPMPEGWTARVGQDGTFRAGPTGRLLLRIDREPGLGDALPSAELMRTTYATALKATILRSDKVEQSPGFVAVTLILSRRGAVAGAPDGVTLLAAKSLGEDLILCSTAPNSSAAEVLAALHACEQAQLAGPGGD